MPPLNTAFGAVLDAGGEGWPGLGHDSPDGAVEVVIPDGTGGWFIGGGFSNVGGYARQRLARLNGDGSVNTAWDPNGYVGVQGGNVNALLLHDGVLYAGGDFTSAGGAARNWLAAFDMTTGTLLPWEAGLGCTGSGCTGAVRALAMGDGVLYIGGSFTTAGGQPRGKIAALDLATAAPTTWNPTIPTNSSTWVNTLALADDLLYVGGYFGQVNGTTRLNIAAIEAGTGDVTPWNPNAGDEVHVIKISGDTAFAGGRFQSIGGATRKGIAALQRSVNTNNAFAWDANLSSSGGGDFSFARVYSIVVRPNAVYMGGNIGRAGINNVYRSGAACVSRTTGEVLPWDPSARNYSGGQHNTLRALAANGSLLYAGGVFNVIGERRRSGVVAFDITTGKPTTWRGDGYAINDVVHALAQKGDTLIIAGAFTQVDGQPRQHLAAVLKSTGQVLNWQVDANAPVHALEIVGNVLYVGGEFTQVNGISRSKLAAVNVATAGVVLSWQANVTGAVKALHATSDRLYFGGDFTAVGSEPRTDVAAVDLSSGQVLSFSPNIIGPFGGPGSVSAITASLSGDTVFIGGSFHTVSGEPRQYLAALDAVTAVPIANWVCDATGEVLALLQHDPALYVGVGASLQGLTTYGVGAVALSSGLAATWDTGLPGGPSSAAARAMVRTDDLLIAVGGWGSTSNSLRRTVAAWSGMNDFEASIDIGTRVEEPGLPRTGMQLVPNPTTGALMLQLPLHTQVRTLWVLDATGRLVLSQAIANTSGSITMDLSGHENGLYLVQVLFADGTRAVERVVKE
jgi:hypothetical protein